MLRKNIVALIFLFPCLFFNLGAGPIPATTRVAPPTASIEPKFHEFGKVRPGKKYVVTSKIINPTAKTLSFWALRSDCTCTNAHVAKSVLKPGTSTLLTVTYQPPEGEYGFKHYEVKFKVYSQEKGQKVEENMVRFFFSSVIDPPFLTEPAVLDGGFTLKGNAKQSHGVLKLDTKVYPKWAAEKVEVSTEGFTAQIKALPTPGAYDVTLQIPESAKSGAYNGKITISGKGKKGDVFEYPFKAVVGSIWKLAPETLDMGILESSRVKNWKGETQIVQVYGKDFKILSVEGMPDWLKYEIQKSKSGGTLLTWKVDQGRFEKAKGSTLPEKLTIQTSLQNMGEFEIPFNAAWEKTVVPTATVEVKKEK